MLLHTYSERVYCAVRNEPLLTIQFILRLEMGNHKYEVQIYCFPSTHTAEI